MCAAIALTSWVRAQNLSPVMPGEVVSSNNTNDSLSRVGKQAPKVGKSIGEPINLPAENPLLRRYDPNKPYDVFRGTNLDVKSIVAPMNGFSQTAGTGDPTMLDRLYSKLQSVVGLSTKPQVQRVYTPGIARRNRERVQERLHPRD